MQQRQLQHQGFLPRPWPPPALRCPKQQQRCRHGRIHSTTAAQRAGSLNDSGGSNSSQRVATLISQLEPKLAHIAHTYVGFTAALLQSASLPGSCDSLQLDVQWDGLKGLHAQLALDGLHPGPIEQQGRGRLGFSMQLQDTAVLVACDLNTVLRMDPDRVQVAGPAGQQLWCESLLSVRQGAPPELAAAVDARLQQLQAELTADNAQAWLQSEAEDAWQNKLGPPEETAQWIRQDPWLRLGRPLFKHLPQDLSGLKLINLMGSHGTKAVAAAVLGAQASCVDISPVNAAYCAKVAAAAGVQVDFVVADVLQLTPRDQLNGAYDIVLLELGVLHYFLDLAPLLSTVRRLLKPGGRLLLREFHPVSTKLITSKGKKHKVTGDYFSQQLVESSVAYSKYAADSGVSEGVRLRQWGLGEVVSAVCQAGLLLQCLEEEAGAKADDAGLPKLFTLVAARPGGR